MPHIAKPFWVLRPLCIDRCAFGFKRTMDHLRSWRMILPGGVRKAEVLLSLKQERDPLSPHHGSKLFLYENIPQLKYHNPQLQVAVKRWKTADSTITFYSDDGSAEEIVTTGLRQRDIQDKIESFSQTRQTEK